MKVVRNSLSALIPLVILASSPADAAAQSERIIPDRVTCTGCAIVLEPLVRLGDAEGPGTIGTLHTAARDSRGRFYVVSRETSFQIQVFDASGRYLQTIGSRGEGPGEYQRISAILVRPGDTLEVLDSRQGRRTILGPDYKVLGSWPFRLSLRQNGVTRLRDGRLVVATMVPTRERVGFPLHFVDSANILRSFGTQAPEMRPDEERRHERSLATTTDGKGFWSASQREYFLEQWSASGDLRRRLVRRAPWFLSRVRPTPGKALIDEFPMSAVTAIQEDSLGRVWTLVQVGDSGWKSAITPTSGGGYQINDYNGHNDTVIEVIEPARGVVIASRRVPQLLLTFVDPATVLSRTESADGVPQAQVWRLSLQQPPTGAAR